MEQAYELLNKVKNKLKEIYPSAQYTTTFENLKEIFKVQGSNIYLIVANSYEKFKLEKLYLGEMNKILNSFSENPMQFKFVTPEDAEKNKEKQDSLAINKVDTSEKTIRERSLRHEYTFENFVAGEANRDAFTIALQVAKNPSIAIYNPFYIFGDVGLGKTHLMMAIGHYILDNNINANVVFTTAQQFYDDFVKSKVNSQASIASSERFDNYYRSADVLLVDDIQYLIDKNKTQDEFFKLFEYLTEKNCQIIVTSDRSANKLKLMDRLKSRFTQGNQVTVQKPDKKLRKAILQNKLATLIENPTIVSDDALDYIASNFEENVRELEGALRRFISYCVSFNYDYTLENAQISLESIISIDKGSFNNSNDNCAENVKNVVADYFNISVKELVGMSRKQELVYARSVAIYLLRTKYNLGLKKIGEYLGDRDHATIAHAIDKIEDGIKTDDFICQDINNLITRLDK